jgi:hypothetical protein
VILGRPRRTGRDTGRRLPSGVERIRFAVRVTLATAAAHPLDGGAGRRRSLAPPAGSVRPRAGASDRSRPAASPESRTSPSANPDKRIARSG